jgi:hypothetical protein
MNLRSLVINNCLSDLGTFSYIFVLLHCSIFFLDKLATSVS